MVTPPLSEQAAIAAFLDRETAKIAALIARQERMIALLGEKRQALIAHAVTKGLRADAPMQDSGVAWLGEIPAHWSPSIKVSTLAQAKKNSFVNGPFGSDLLTSELQDDGVPVIYIRDIKPEGYKRVSTVFVTEAKSVQLSFCRVDSGDVVIAKVGDPPGTASIYPSTEPSGIVTQDVIRIKADPSVVVSEYLVWVLNSWFGQVTIDLISVESIRTRISLGAFKNARILLPRVAE